MPLCRSAIAAIIVLFLGLGMPVPVRADVTVCPLDEALSRLEEYNIRAAAEIATKNLRILEELKSLTDKAKNPSLPTGAQLSKEDQDRFQELRFQMLLNQARRIVDSGYLRDSRVIARAAKAAYSVSQGHTYDKNDPDFFYYGIILMLSVQHPSDKLAITTPKEGECSVEAGLYFDEKLAGTELNGLPVKEAVERLQEVAQKYQLDIKQQGWFDKIPSLQEKQSATGDMATVKRGNQLLDYLNNVENLKALARVSALASQSDIEDIRVAHNEDELSRMGTGWTDRVKNYDEQTQFLSGLLNLIGKKVPSDSAIEAEGMTKRLQQQGVIR